MNPPKPKKKNRIKLAGQVKYASLRDAHQAIEETLGELHVQTTERVRNERRGR